LRAALAGAGFTEDRLAAVARACRTTPDEPPSALVWLRHLSAPSPLRTLVEALVFGRDVSEEEAATAFAPLDLARVVATGLIAVEPVGARVVPSVALSPHQGMWMAHDRLRPGWAGRRADHVVGVGPSSITLSNASPRRPAERALDLGVGSGWQALLASRYCRQVVGVDVNPRALNLAAFNAALNGVDNLELRLGSWFSPVAGETFDLVVCNPPFVISPDQTFAFRDSGMTGDDASEWVVRQAASSLRESGVATVMCNWVHGRDDDWSAPPRRWLSASGTDAVVVRLDTLDPLQYAATWNRGMAEEERPEVLDRWTAYYRRQAVDAITIGLVVLRRRSGVANWLRAEELRTAPGPNFGTYLDRLGAGQDLLSDSAADERLRQCWPRLVEGHRLEWIRTWHDGHYVDGGFKLRLAGSLGRTVSVRPAAVALLEGCDGSRPLSEMIERIAPTLGGDRRRAEARVVGAVRQLVDLGFMELLDPGRREVTT